MDGVINEFITEGEEILHRISGLLHKIEKQGCDRESISAIYRDVHTLKGNSQLFGFLKIANLSHVMEASLDPIRKSNIVITPRMIETCFKSLDLLARMLKSIQTGGSETELEHEATAQIAYLIDSACEQFKVDCIQYRDPGVLLETQQVHVETLKKTEPTVVSVPKTPKIEFVPVITNTMTENNAVLSSVKQNGTDSTAVDSSIRVPVNLLDRLMNLVGELVLIRNQVLQYNQKHENLELMILSKGLDGVVTDLQTDVMMTRMQPISVILSKYQRLVREVSRELGKKIDLTLEGSETELDKTILEAIRDPLTHLVRNACDHGVEDQAERIQAGKPDNGHVLIRSYHESGQVVIEISDDGRGLDTKKIIKKALEKGIITKEQSTRLQEREIFNMILLPGFTTANQVSAVSGRGVGMDVVKNNIEKAGGTVELSSIAGKSTTVRLRIPLTLAIVPSMLVKCKNEIYAIPQVKLVQLVRVEHEQSAQKIEYLQGKPFYRLRENLLPLIDLGEIVGISNKRDYKNGVNIVVLSVEKDLFGLIVDEILDTTDIVVKPLGKFLKNVGLFTGATILGNGEVSLILDVTGIATNCKINTKKNITDEYHLQSIAQAKAKADEQEFLLFHLDTGVTHGIPLCLVSRLEEFETSKIENSGNQRMIR